MRFAPYTIATSIAGFLQNIYVRDSEVIYDLISKINKDVYTHIDELKKVSEEDYSYYDEYIKEFNEDIERFNEFSLFECSVLVDSLSLYFKMRENGILGPKKVLKNERNE